MHKSLVTLPAIAVHLLLASAIPGAFAETVPQPSAYVGQQTRAIKSLSEQDVDDLLAGRGTGFAKAAELNGYPGPAHVLELREPLTLSEAQLGATQVWQNSVTDPVRALAQYKSALALGGTVTLPQLFSTAGAHFSFDVDTFAAAIGAIEREIEALDAVASA